MGLKFCGLAGFGIEFHGQITTVLQQFNSRERWAKVDVEKAPMASFAQGGAEFFCGVAEKSDSGNAGEETAFPKDEIGVKMADDGLLQLRKAGANGPLVPEVGECGG